MSEPIRVGGPYPGDPGYSESPSVITMPLDPVLRLSKLENEVERLKKNLKETIDDKWELESKLDEEQKRHAELEAEIITLKEKINGRSEEAV